MIRNLLVFSGIALLVSVVCLGGAAALASRDVQHNGLSWSWFEKNGNFHFSRADPDYVFTPTTKTLSWTGSRRLSVDVPANLTYVQGEQNSVQLSGPSDLVDAVIVDGDRIRLKDGVDGRHKINFNWRDGDLEIDGEVLTITVTAPAINDFNISGAGDLNLQNYNQPSLNVNLSGMGNVEATGTTESLSVSISGAGDADLEALVTRDANVNVSGKGDATIAPTGAVAINVSGMGNVKLKTRPASVTSNISGMGKVEQE